MIKFVKATALLLALFCASTVVAAPRPEDVVKSYYGYMKNLRSAQNEDDAYKLRKSIQKCFYSPGNGVDEGFSGVNVKDNYINKDVVASNTFAGRIARAIHREKSLTIDSHSISNIEKSTQPNLTGGDDEIYQICVSVNYSFCGENKQCTDYINIYKSNIVKISDEPSFKKSSDNRSGEFNAEKSTELAGSMYSRKQYKEAYAEYKKILDHDPNDINALYRLAIMTAKGHGVKRNIDEAISLLHKVNSVRVNYNHNYFYRLWDLKTKATDAIYFLEHPHSV